MKKTRMISMLLAVLTVMSCVFFAGCGDKEESTVKSTSTRDIVALNMYILTEDTTTEAAANQVEMAINRILLPNHKTLVNINYLTQENYWDAVDAMLEETKENPAIDNAQVAGAEGKAFTDMIEYLFADSTTSIELNKPQIDILVVNDYDKYTQLANDGLLKGIGSFITYDSKILKTTIHPTLMSAAMVGTETYGVPTNIGVDAGEYTYLVFNEDLVKKYGYEVKQLRNFASVDFQNYLLAVKNGETGIWPISGPLEIAGAEYYDDAFISLNSQFNYIASDARPIYMYTAYNDNRKAQESYKELGLYPAFDMGDYSDYAIKIEKSKELLTADSDKRWTDATGTTYVRYLYDIPRVEIDEAFTSVMSVSATSPVPERAMELITLFNTDSELANLLQYGVEGTHYQVNQLTGDIASLTDEYAMDNIITGNTYIKYPEDNDKEYVSKAIAKNLNVAPSAYLGFNLNLSASDMSSVELIKSISHAATKAVKEGRLTYDQARQMAAREMLYLGYDTNSSGEVMGVFGMVQKAQAQLSDPIEAGFGLGKDVLEYNEQFGIYLGKRPVVVKTEEPAEDGAEAENEAAEGEALEGEVVEGEVAEGEVAEGETAEAEEVAEG